MWTKRRKIAVALLLPVPNSLSSSSFALAGTKNEFSLERRVEMEGTGCSDVEWTIDREAQQATFAVRSAPGADWVGLGLSTTRGMRGADIMMVRRIKNDNGFEVDDRYSQDYEKPELDVLQNLELPEAYADDHDRIRALLRRRLETCDKDDMSITVATKRYLVCASGPIDPDSGDILYHGPNYGKALVNLFVDEDLLTSRKLVLPDIPQEDSTIDGQADNDNSSSFLSPGVRFHGNPMTSTAPFAIDVQLMNTTVSSSETIAHRCATFVMPLDLNLVAVLVVWSGNTAGMDLSTSYPPYLHHQVVYHCRDPEALDPTLFKDGVVLSNCLDYVPQSCERHFTQAGSGITETPASVHIPLRQGRYVLMVHYDNSDGVDIEDDSVGLRLWVEPPMVVASSPLTNPGQVHHMYGQHNTIYIPADPQRRKLSLSFEISSDATRAMVPTEGVQVFSSHVHMNKVAGYQAQVKLIRNGVHIANVVQYDMYDFDAVAPTWNLWKLLPGDTLIITCTYRPLPDRDVVGGWSMDDEMCILVLGIAPELPNVDYAVGYMVRDGDPFLRSYMGLSNGFVPETLEYEYAECEPNEDSFYQPMADESICELGIRDETYLPKTAFAAPGIPAQTILLVIFASGFFSSRWPRIQHIDSERERRNTTIYVVHLIFSLVALPIVLAEVIRTGYLRRGNGPRGMGIGPMHDTGTILVVLGGTFLSHSNPMDGRLAPFGGGSLGHFHQYHGGFDL